MTSFVYTLTEHYIIPTFHHFLISKVQNTYYSVSRKWCNVEMIYYTVSLVCIRKMSQHTLTWSCFYSFLYSNPTSSLIFKMFLYLFPFCFCTSVDMRSGNGVYGSRCTQSELYTVCKWRWIVRLEIDTFPM